MEGGDRTYESHGSSLAALLQLGDCGGGSTSSSSSFSSTGTSGEESAESSSEISLLDEDRFFRRLLTRESASSRPGLSSRVYYRAAGKVPFDWEIAPGKPKKPTQDDKLPPLSPPPSVHVALPRSCEPEKSRFWFLNASSKRIRNGLRHATTPNHGGNKGISSGPAGSLEDVPATEKEFVWPANDRTTYSCLPFHFSGVFGPGNRSPIN